HRRVMRHPAFRAGDYDTGFIERHKADLLQPAPDEETAALAAIAAAAEAARRLSAPPPPAPSRSALLLAFGTLYLVWGSTYLAIRIAVASVPPFVAGALRFAVAGGGLYLFMRLRGAPRPAARNWGA